MLLRSRFTRDAFDMGDDTIRLLALLGALNKAYFGRAGVAPWYVGQFSCVITYFTGLCQVGVAAWCVNRSCLHPYKNNNGFLGNLTMAALIADIV